MNPTVEAAWIAAGVGALGIVATTIVAWIGAVNTKRATTTALEAAHDDKVYDKRAEVYIDLLSVVSWTQAIRENWRKNLSEGQSAESSAPVEPIERDLFAIEAKTLAFSKAAVFTAQQAHATAVLQAYKAYNSWVRGQSHVARSAVLDAIKAADDASGKLIQFVRLELTGDRTHLPDWHPPALAPPADSAGGADT